MSELLFIKDLADGTEYTLSNSTDDSKLGGEVDRADGCAAMQRDHNRLEKMDPLNVCGKVWDGSGGCRGGRWGKKVESSPVPVTVGPAGPATDPPQAKA